MMNLRLRSANDKKQYIYEDIKGMVLMLPVVLAENPQEKFSADGIFYKGTNLIHKHEFQKAIHVLSGDLLIEISDNVKQREMIKFNKAYCHFKMD